MDLEDVARSILSQQPLIPRLGAATDQALHDAICALGISDIELIVVIEEILINAREHGCLKAIV